MKFNHVIKRLLVSEKSAHLSSVRNCYSFEVAINATKPQIKDVVESAWGVRVIGVRIHNRQGESVRRASATGVTKQKKRALVTLHLDDRLSFY